MVNDGRVSKQSILQVGLNYGTGLQFVAYCERNYILQGKERQKECFRNGPSTLMYNEAV